MRINSAIIVIIYLLFPSSLFAQEVSVSCLVKNPLFRIYERITEEKYKQIRPDCSTKVSIRIKGGTNRPITRQLVVDTVADEITSPRYPMSATEYTTWFDTASEDSNDGLWIELLGLGTLIDSADKHTEHYIEHANDEVMFFSCADHPGWQNAKIEITVNATCNTGIQNTKEVIRRVSEIDWPRNSWVSGSKFKIKP